MRHDDFCELGVVKTATPCGEPWEAMQGDDVKRFCGRCRLFVYDFAALTTEEARALLVRTEGRLCGRIFTREDGTVCLDTNTLLARTEVPDLTGEGKLSFLLDRLDLAAGSYFLDVGVFEKDWKHAYDYHWHAHPFTVEGAPSHKGLVAPPCRWEMVR